MNDTQLRALTAKESTPLYVYDLTELEQRVRSLRQRLPQSVGLCYAVKANTFILEEVSRLVDRLEICSPGELRICRGKKLPSRQFVISGVYKTPDLIRELVAENGEVGLYTVESARQMELLAQAARDHRRRLPLLLRLTSGNQFGLDEEELIDIVRRYGDDPWLELRGIQYFSGTQKTSLKRLKKELEYVDTILRRLGEDCDFEAAELEFGPGFPVFYFEGEEFDEDAFLRGFSELLAGLEFSGKITLELGRSIAASCGRYLTRIVDLKTNRKQNYAVVDGGIHQLVYYGQSMAMKHPLVQPLSPRPGDGGEPELWNICGSLCTVNDILIKQLPLNRPEIGDILVFENTGAYCASEGIALFLSRDLPAVVWLRQGCEPEIVRPATPIEGLNTPNYEKR